MTTYKLRLTSEELFLVQDLVRDEKKRINELLLTGVGLQAIAANNRNEVLWSILHKLNKHTKSGP